MINSAYQFESFQNDIMATDLDMHSLNRVPCKLGAIPKQIAEGSNLTRVRLCIQVTVGLETVASILSGIECIVLSFTPDFTEPVQCSTCRTVFEPICSDNLFE